MDLVHIGNNWCTHIIQYCPFMSALHAKGSPESLRGQRTSSVIQ